MSQVDKSLAHSSEDCEPTFTSEDDLNGQKSKHCMMLSLELETRNAFIGRSLTKLITIKYCTSTYIFVADQTPTPTRFIRNCEEVGLFQDLQNVNPFDETFKKAAELVNSGCLHVPEICTDDTLHTPHILPHTIQESSEKFTINRVPSLDEDLLKMGNKETDCDHLINNETIQNSVDSIIARKNDETDILNKSAYKTQELCSDNFSIPSIDEQLLIIDTIQSDSDDDIIVIDECVHINKENNLHGSQKVTRADASSSFLMINSDKQALGTANTCANYVNKVHIREGLKNKVNSTSQKPKIVNNEQVVFKKSTVIENLKNVTTALSNRMPDSLLPQPPRKRVVTNSMSRVQCAKKAENNEHVTAEKQKVREINRAAQLRSRAKKKLWINGMQTTIDKLKAENKFLLTENQTLKNEIFAVKSVLLYHKDCEISKNPLASKCFQSGYFSL